MRIVVVDEPDVAAGLVELLRVHDLEVRCACDRTEALRQIDIFKPHCVIFDLELPAAGADLARVLRLRHGVDLVLIAMTGDTRLDRVMSPRVRDADHCLVKPLSLTELSRLLALPQLAAAADEALPGGQV